MFQGSLLMDSVRVQDRERMDGDSVRLMSPVAAVIKDHQAEYDGQKRGNAGVRNYG